MNKKVSVAPFWEALKTLTLVWFSPEITKFCNVCTLKSHSKFFVANNPARLTIPSLLTVAPKQLHQLPQAH